MNNTHIKMTVLAPPDGDPDSYVFSAVCAIVNDLLKAGHDIHLGISLGPSGGICDVVAGPDTPDDRDLQAVPSSDMVLLKASELVETTVADIGVSRQVLVDQRWHILGHAIQQILTHFDGELLSTVRVEETDNDVRFIVKRWVKSAGQSHQGAES